MTLACSTYAGEFDLVGTVVWSVCPLAPIATFLALLLSASYFCSNYVFYFFFNWLFIYLVENRGFKIL